MCSFLACFAPSRYRRAAGTRAGAVSELLRFAASSAARAPHAEPDEVAPQSCREAAAQRFDPAARIGAGREIDLRRAWRGDDERLVAEGGVSIIEPRRRDAGPVLSQQRLIHHATAGGDGLLGRGKRSIFPALVLFHVMEVVVDHYFVLRHSA